MDNLEVRAREAAVAAGAAFPSVAWFITGARWGYEQGHAEQRGRAACIVCGGDGKPVSGLPCICGGSGEAQAAQQALTVMIHDKEQELAEQRRELADRLEKFVGETAVSGYSAHRIFEIVRELRAEPKEASE
jgi:hypothetical protein